MEGLRRNNEISVCGIVVGTRPETIKTAPVYMALKADTRISRDHTFVYPQSRGFSGKCLPKDVNAIVKSCADHDYEACLLRAVLEINEGFCNAPQKLDRWLS